jgi:hypothetical protein
MRSVTAAPCTSRVAEIPAPPRSARPFPSLLKLVDRSAWTWVKSGLSGTKPASERPTVDRANYADLCRDIPHFLRMRQRTLHAHHRDLPRHIRGSTRSPCPVRRCERTRAARLGTTPIGTRRLPRRREDGRGRALDAQLDPRSSGRLPAPAAKEPL